MKLKVNQLPEIISQNVKGTTAVSIDVETEPRMRKTGNPFLGVKKLATMNGIIGFDYESGINRQAAREGKEARVAQARTWGQLSEDRIFVLKDGEIHSIQMKVQSATNVRYMLNGQEVSKESIKPFLPEKSESTSQADLENPIIVRDIKLSNIRAIRFKNVEVEVVPE